MSNSLVSIEFDSQHESLAGQLGATFEQVSLAQRRAVNKLAGWLQTQILRDASKEVNVAQKPLKARFRLRRGEGANPTARIWIGLNPISARRLGKLEKTTTGAKAGRRFFRHAFIATAKKSSEQVWRRKGSSRLPIEKVTVPIAEGFEEVLDRYEAAAERRFEEIFDHELKYVMGWFN